MSIGKLRKSLVALVAFGAVGTAVGAGTFASFSASTANASNTFATGTLVLSNQKDTATACLSTGGGTTDSNTNTGCDRLFALTVQRPGDAATADLTLRNDGSLDASALRAFADGACAAADAAGADHHGTGDPCGAVSVYIQEFGDSARTTPSACHYGGGTATTCAHGASATLASFASDHVDAATALGLGATSAATSRYFTIGLQLDGAAGNDMQGRQATFGFTWQLAQ